MTFWACIVYHLCTCESWIKLAGQSRWGHHQGASHLFASIFHAISSSSPGGVDRASFIGVENTWDFVYSTKWSSISSVIQFLPKFTYSAEAMWHQYCWIPSLGSWKSTCTSIWCIHVFFLTLMYIFELLHAMIPYPWSWKPRLSTAQWVNHPAERFAGVTIPSCSASVSVASTIDVMYECHCSSNLSLVDLRQSPSLWSWLACQ